MRRHLVAAVMTTNVVVVRPQTPFKRIATLLSRHDISAVPVVDADHHVLGVVSETDLVAKYDQPQADRPPLWSAKRRDAWLKATATTATDLMTSPAVTIAQDAAIATAAKLMTERDVKRLPVVDQNERLVGIVSRHDLIGVFVRPDDEIATEIHDEVLLRALCTDPAGIDVRVFDGVVSLRGQLERRSMLPIAEALCRRVDGVVDVTADLTYALDDTKIGDGTVPQNVGILHGMWGPH
jgi:CBS-domain-containing membrane protein